MMHSAQHGAERLASPLRRNAMPLALIAAGAVWLYRSNRGDARPSNDWWTARHSEYDTMTEYDEYDEDVDAGPAALADADGRDDRPRRVSQRVGDAARRTQARMGEISHRARSGFDRMMQNNPLALGLIAVAVGVAVGLSVPGTDRERELMGDARDRLVDKAQDVARDARGKVERAVGLS